MMIENPFVISAGNEIEEKYFIGRESEIRFNVPTNIETSIFQHRPLNLAIIGILGIGKRNLTHKAVLKRKSELSEKNTLLIWIDVSQFDNSQQFFGSLVVQCVNEMKQLGWLTDTIQNSANPVTEAVRSNADLVDEIQNFFREVGEAGYHSLFILDRFDRAGSIFKGNRHFQLLRNLARTLHYHLSLLLISCRSIVEIEKKAGSTSPFYELFTLPIRLAMFSDEDLETYFSKFSGGGISLSPTEKARVMFYCGAHPHFLQVLGYQIVEKYRQTGKIDVDNAARDIHNVFSFHYQHLTEFLEDVRLLNPLLQIVSGSPPSVRTGDKDELERYGLIKSTEDGAYTVYSEHFYNYLSELHQDSAKAPLKSTSSSESLGTNHQAPKRSTESTSTLGFSGSTNISVTDIWTQTENALRKTITTIMSAEFGDDWIGTVRSSDEELESIFKRCKKTQEQHSSNYPGAINNLPDLINFFQPSDLFKIVLHQNLWEYFREFFGKTDPNTDGRWKNHWNQAEGIILHRFRHPDRHSNNEHIPEYAKQTAEGYCKEILEICNKVEESRSSEQERIEQGEGEQEELYMGKVFAVNEEDSFANITIEGYPSLNWSRVSKCDFQNEDAFGLNKNVKFKIEETSNGFHVRNVVLAEGG